MKDVTSLPDNDLHSLAVSDTEGLVSTPATPPGKTKSNGFLPGDSVATPTNQSEVAGKIDGLSLTQALIDAEVANLRAADLTKRLIESNIRANGLTTTMSQLAQDLQALRLELRAAQTRYDELVASKAYQLMKVIWAIRRMLRV